eukprot:1160168-Pelagomonas_calceolata.AAC.1
MGATVVAATAETGEGAAGHGRGARVGGAGAACRAVRLAWAGRVAARAIAPLHTRHIGCKSMHEGAGGVTAGAVAALHTGHTERKSMHAWCLEIEWMCARGLVGCQNVFEVRLACQTCT